MLLAALFTFLYLPPFMRLLTDCKLLRLNYAQQPLPFSTGIALAFAVTWSTCLSLLLGWYPTEQAGALLLLFNGFALLGLLDDVGGQLTVKGWRGHIRQLMAGQLSTGMVKVLYGGGLAVAAAALSSTGTEEILVNAGLIALGAALFNQLDVRPGRAATAFLGATALGILLGGSAVLGHLTPVVGAVLVYLPFDRGRHAMLGDSGSNALGAAWGWGLLAVPLGWRWLILLCATILHCIGDNYSLQRLIERRDKCSRDDQPQ